MIQLTSGRFFIMDTTHYWPFAREYSIWNAAVEALQFWMADLNPQTISNSIEWVYTAFICSTSSQQLRNTLEDVLCNCFMTMLNDAFELELALEDGYDSGSENLSIPTSLCRAPCLYHISAGEICLLDLPHLKHTHLNGLATSTQHATIWCLKKMMTPQWTATHSMLEQNTIHLQNTKWLTTSPVVNENKKKKKKKNSQQLHWMMTFGWKNQFQTDTHASMNIHNCMTCALTLAHTAWISYTLLQNMHQHLCTWTSVTSSTSQMW